MKRCIIIGAGEYYGGAFEIKDGDYVISADGGYLHCEKMGIKPDLAVGDWDSLAAAPKGCEIFDLPVEKDDTDTLAAIRIGLEKGFDEFHILFGTGGRLDHTLANMQCLVYLADCGKRGYLYGKKQVVTAVRNESVSFSEKAAGDISVFAADGTACGVTETGLKYSLDNYDVTSAFPIGVSNSFVGTRSVISVKNGALYIIFPLGEMPL
ncbi:MAG: thiamine diphosphokinase [Firmicutes bacterium]|nr:thiamine diphosphokinase [Bacillota bacterium]